MNKHPAVAVQKERKKSRFEYSLRFRSAGSKQSL